MERLTVRAAKVGDYRRKLVSERAGWTTRLSGFSFDGVQGLGSGSISFASPLTFITGPNGVGKSTIMQGIRAATGDEDIVRQLVKDSRLATGTVSIEGTTAGVGFERSVNLGQAAANIVQLDDIANFAVTYVESARDAIAIQHEFRKFESLEEITNGVAAVDLSTADLATISQIVKRQYRFAKLYEVELGEIAPFFEVGHGDTTYDSRTMGDGEMAALLLWWHLWRAPKNSIYLIEEPESFLSSACQGAMLNFFMMQAVERRLWLIVASHSGQFLQGASAEALRFFNRVDGGVELLDREPPPVLLQSVGIDIPLRGQVFVEDTAAAALTRQILEKFNPKLSRSLNISSRGGDGEVVTAVRNFNGLNLPLIGIGLFDGDIGENISDDVKEYSTTLPGDVAIEKVFKEIANSQVVQLSEISGRENVAAVLATLAGEEHHDWLEECSRGLGLDKSQLFFLLFRLWIDHEQNFAASQATVEALAVLAKCP